MSTETRCPKCGALFCECQTEKGNEMLNKCRCGENAKLHKLLGRWFAVCVSKTCGRTAYGDSEENAQCNWNSENSGLVNPPEDFEKRFKEAIKGITRLLHDNVDDDEFLPEFLANFGFDLKEAMREQWGMK